VRAADEQAPSLRGIRRLPRLFALLAIVLFIALLAYGLSANAPDDTIDERLADNRSAPAPAFSLEVLDEGTLRSPLNRAIGPALRDGELALEELRGTPVVLNLWASWCDPCREEAPRLRQGWQRWGKRGVLFLGLDIQDIRSDARDFLREFRITYPTIREPGREVATRYGATGIPETYFISARGRVVGHVIGVVSVEQLDSGVAAARAGTPAGAREGGARRPTR
jgi:cytochrome c biogenesis protein CcmG/thiol:disulfide interchange protein DsbE